VVLFSSILNLGKYRTYWRFILASILLLIATAIFLPLYWFVALVGVFIAYFLLEVRKQYLTQNSRLTIPEIIIYVIVPAIVFFVAILVIVYQIAFRSVSFFEATSLSMFIAEFIFLFVILVGAFSTLRSAPFRSKTPVLLEALSYYDGYQRLKRRKAILCRGNITPSNVSFHLVRSRFISSLSFVFALLLFVAQIFNTLLSISTTPSRDLLLLITLIVACLGAASTPIVLYPTFLLRNITVYSIQGTRKENLLDSWSKFSNKLRLGVGIPNLIFFPFVLYNVFGGFGYYLFSVFLIFIISGAICYVCVILYTVLEESVGQDNIAAIQQKVPPCPPQLEDAETGNK